MRTYWVSPHIKAYDSEHQTVFVDVRTNTTISVQLKLA